MFLEASDIFICPLCHTRLIVASGRTLACPTDGAYFNNVDGIWHLLLPEAETRLANFMQQYERVRVEEGRGSNDPEFYRSLPYPIGVSRRWRSHWKLRARGYEYLLSIVSDLGPMPLTILDLGSGNGWLSNRLAERGHDVIAVDLQTNDYDGLGCHKHYETMWIPVQSEFDRLPIADGIADVIIFNASLHYSTDLHRTLAEAVRVLKTNGVIAIVDSPLYRTESSGRKMLLEQGYDVDDRIGFLTPLRLQTAARALGLVTEFSISPASPAEFFLRIGKRLLLRREPASLIPILLRRT